MKKGVHLSRRPGPLPSPAEVVYSVDADDRIEWTSETWDRFAEANGWCNAVDVAGRWVELEAAVEELRLLHGPYPPAITHGLCPGCAESLMAAARAPAP